MRRSTWWRVLGVAIIIVSAVWVVDRSDGGTGGAPPTEPRSGSTSTSLPAEVGETLALVDAGGPFPYDRDGTVFMNRERLLPREERGFWREYTVPTPGESDRGARRLVVGRDGSVWYSDDHYGSFRRIREPGP